ncbi:MAG: MOSC N-terminal beta barrel domain-containing protein [Massilia sp.]
MAILSQLIVYPIKSCAGITVPAARVERAGLSVDGVRDREWMLVDPAGRFLTQREHPRMALIVPRLIDGAVEVSAPGLAPFALTTALGAAATRQVTLWDDSVAALDCGDAAALWFSAALGAACRLVRLPPAPRQGSTRWTGGLANPVTFSDGYPLLLIGAASLADLNDKLAAAGRAPLPMDRFRPNLVVDGLAAFEEDYAASLSAGALRFKPVKPCPRCPIPSVDQRTGVPGPNPLDILQAYRAKPQLDGAICFGMNCLLTEGEGALLTVGAEVEVELSF